MAMHFEIVLLGCSVAPSEARSGKAWLNIKCWVGRHRILNVL